HGVLLAVNDTWVPTRRDDLATPWCTATKNNASSFGIVPESCTCPLSRSPVDEPFRHADRQPGAVLAGLRRAALRARLAVAQARGRRALAAPGAGLPARLQPARGAAAGATAVAHLRLARAAAVVVGRRLGLAGERAGAGRGGRLPVVDALLRYGCVLWQHAVAHARARRRGPWRSGAVASAPLRPPPLVQPRAADPVDARHGRGAADERAVHHALPVAGIAARGGEAARLPRRSLRPLPC